MPHQPSIPGPAAFWKHYPIADQSAQTLVAATLAFQSVTRSAIVKLTPAGNYQIADRGGLAYWDGDPLGRRSFRTRAVNTPADWFRIAQHTQLTPIEQAMVAAAAAVRAAIGPTTPLLATVFSPLSQALMLAGPERLAADLAAQHPALIAALDSLQHTTEQLIAHYAQAGVDGLYLAMQHLTEHNLPQLLYRQTGLRIDDAIMQACSRFSLNILHLHGTPIHLDCLTATALHPGSSWMIHYELQPDNPSPERFRAQCACPVVLGLPFALWDQPERLAQAATAMRSRFAQAQALLTGPCVVPLAVTDTQIAQWVETAHAIS